MKLEVYDSCVGDNLSANVEVATDDAAKDFICGFMRFQSENPPEIPTTRFVLMDDEGIRADWTVFDGPSVELVEKSPRFVGDWGLGSRYFFEKERKQEIPS